MLIYLSERYTHNYGYHVGDISEKSELMTRRNFNVGVRGALGTGIYFFGNIDDAKKYLHYKNKISKAQKEYRQNIKMYKVDFSQYRLFKPQNPSAFYDNLVVPITNQVIKHLTVNDFDSEDVLETLRDASDFYREEGVEISDDDFIKISYNFVKEMNNKKGGDDNFNTRILKAAGFEGIDNRGSSLDDFNSSANVGSVIFDLKKNTIETM